MSQLKLNLGAGVFPLPYVKGEEPNQKHTLPLPDVCYEPGWVNVDTLNVTFFRGLKTPGGGRHRPVLTGPSESSDQ